METSLVAPVTVAAMLVIRTALVEMRHPGSARRQWCFLARRHPMTAGATAAVLLCVGGWRAAGIASVAWAVLAGALVAHVVHLSTGPEADKTENRNGGRH
ncbi:hypothetical protein F7R91_03910 [Streptomyces luteolifulvus]|jgi:hypothetical protein|uniref:Uncharacterized protein n=1 Tax=Streptomyces luteolifulvus TaxID=2615112 RepID=A0A6H9V7J8_9ACTN|nr:hypothetical protein [Streptomyces luteolifulvus]KAB1149980.1 hypothetical protein F7R91_03910 [Streptomyces luteolifulvus]